MAKTRTNTLYVCSHCGAKSHKWVGQCSSCDSWNTLDLVTTPVGSPTLPGDVVAPARLAEVVTKASERYQTGLSELDRVLGGGIVPGSVVLLGGEARLRCRLWGVFPATTRHSTSALKSP